VSFQKIIALIGSKLNILIWKSNKINFKIWNYFYLPDRKWSF